MGYTTFEYGDLKLSSHEVNRDDWKITATINVKNTGSRDADEVVQLYIRDMVASISRPVKEQKETVKR